MGETPPPPLGAGLNDGRPVLIVDDEPVVRDVVARYLRRDGFETCEAADGEAARDLIESRQPCLAIVDVMLPGVDGFDLCRWIRSRSDMPVILLTARADEADRIVGLELGADDYVCKPFSPRELAVRVRTVLRRTAPEQTRTETLSFGDVLLAWDSREVTRDGRTVPVTAREFELLWFLASHPRRVFSREHLMERVWGYTAAVDTGTVTVHVRRLREKIEADPAAPAHLHTVWGAGYRLDP
jgi:DNA-binding response OmpR family regulator